MRASALLPPCSTRRSRGQPHQGALSPRRARRASGSLYICMRTVYTYGARCTDRANLPRGRIRSDTTWLGHPGSSHP
jgi:hypothetical protein